MQLNQTIITNIAIGIVLLFLGRKLFWFYVGALGFIIGFDVVNKVLAGQSAMMILAVAIAIGLFGILLAIFFQKLAIGASGFFAGGYLAFTFLGPMNLVSQELAWIIFFIGGLIGGFLAILLFDWAIIILSSLMGSLLILQAAGLKDSLLTVCWLVLAAVGMAIQARLLAMTHPVA